MSGGGGGGLLKTIVGVGLTFLMPGSAAFTMQLFAKRLVFSYALGALAKATAPKFSTPAEAIAQQAQSDITSNNPIQTWKIPYGECITGGTLIYADVDASDSNWLNMLVAYSPVQINRYLDIFINEDLVYSNRSSTYSARMRTSRYCSSQMYDPNVMYTEDSFTDDTLTILPNCQYHVTFAITGGTFSFDGVSQFHQDINQNQSYGVGDRYLYIKSNTGTSNKTVSLTFQEDRNNSSYNGYKYYAFVFSQPMEEEFRSDYQDVFFPILYDGSNDHDDDTVSTVPNINNLRGDTPYHAGWGIPVSEYYLRDVTATDSDVYPRDNPNFWWDNNGFANHPVNGTSSGSLLPIESKYAQTGTDVESDDVALFEKIAFGHFILKKDDVFQQQMPNISVVVEGKKVLDTRGTDTTAYSQNPVWILRDYLTNAEYGAGIPSSEIDQNSFESVANLCDEYVEFSGDPSTDSNATSFTGSTDPSERTTWMVFRYDSVRENWVLRSPLGLKMLPFDKGDIIKIKGYPATSGGTLTNAGSGTGYNLEVKEIIDGGKGCVIDYGDVILQNTTVLYQAFVEYRRLRYRCNGLVDTGNSKKTNIDNILSTMAAKLVWQSGKYILIGGEYRSSSGTINDENIIGPITFSQRASQRDSFNQIKAVFNSKNVGFIPTDIDLVDEGGTFVTQDNSEKSTADLNLPLVTNQAQAAALARIALMRQRFSKTISMTCDLSVYRFSVGDTVRVHTTKLSSHRFTDFEILSMKLNIGESPSVDIELQETDSTIWDDVF